MKPIVQAGVLAYTYTHDAHTTISKNIEIVYQLIYEHQTLIIAKMKFEDEDQKKYILN